MVKIKKYSYNLPKELIASKPAEPRDLARLLIYNTKENTIKFDKLKNLHLYIPKKSLLVLNNTKVLPARVTLKKDTGGRVEVLFLINEKGDGGIFKIIADRKLSIGQKIYFQSGDFLTVVNQEENFFYLKPNFSIKKLDFLLERFGITPIPKYLGKTLLDEKELRKRYQSIFAKNPASVAAPTASLHFTKDVFKKLEQKGNSFAEITLHVGLGTFAPLKKENIKTKKLHKEWYEIKKREWEKIKKNEFVIAVGTTSVRALESAARDKKFSGPTDLFIFPPFDFKIVDGLLTNFHLPGSSLMFLVDAFLQHKKSKKNIEDLYQIAIKEKMRFYSFGDAMLII